ncbi:MAG TPA: FKBP-type peptidyl-prolyl cis-trans isomerase [Chitinophagaceae bacterium]|nr:FKBP-type peptidyl-prolyl cis-trans isomerase [Chitinophagaceae bacterium]
MKNIFLGFIILSAVFVSCSKDETCKFNDSTVVAPASETTAVEAYLTANGITNAQKHPAGFYYKITQAGTGKSIVNLCSNVLVNYTGRFTNGTYFDPTIPGTTSSAEFTLDQVIPGWQKGLPLINAGGKITLYIPPSLGYGKDDLKNPNTGVVVIPGNSILIFDVDLVNVS